MRIITLIILLFAVVVGGISCAPSPSQQPVAVLMSAPLNTMVVYPPLIVYNHHTLISPPITYSAYNYNANPYSLEDNNKPRLYLLACYILPYYENPYLSLLCLIGLIGGSISQRSGLENANSDIRLRLTSKNHLREVFGIDLIRKNKSRDL